MGWGRAGFRVSPFVCVNCKEEAGGKGPLGGEGQGSVWMLQPGGQAGWNGGGGGGENRERGAL